MWFIVPCACTNSHAKEWRLNHIFWCQNYSFCVFRVMSWALILIEKAMCIVVSMQHKSLLWWWFFDKYISIHICVKKRGKNTSIWCHNDHLCDLDRCDLDRISDADIYKKDRCANFYILPSSATSVDRVILACTCLRLVGRVESWFFDRKIAICMYF